MGKKKDKLRKEKHHKGDHHEAGHHRFGGEQDGGKQDGGKQDARRDAPGGAIPAPLAGLAAMVTREVTKQLQSPATRALMATGLRAAADALAQPKAPPAPPAPPAAPEPAAAPQPAAQPVPPEAPPTPQAAGGGSPPQGTTKAPDTQAIAGAIEDAAKLVLGRLFAKPR